MLATRPALKLWFIGSLGGLLFGLSYWFAWGCRNCAKDNSPVALIAFCVIVGAAMARAWGIDHIRPTS